MRSLLAQHCLLCSAGSGTSLLCGGCKAALPWLARQRCQVCALPVSGGSVCGACLAAPPRYDRVCAAFVYRFPVNGLIQALKYGDNLAVARLLGESLARTVASEAVDLVIPMPLSVQRLRERGFNQALEIARYVVAAVNGRLCHDLVQRPVHTAAQASLPWRARARNVRGAFVCTEDLGGLRIAIVDDVMTTGATLNELAKTLRRAGAAEVRGWIVARALKQTSPIGVSLSSV
ncbi:MAG: ComF family protein [Betaproteobacteria bacterium]